MKYTWANTLLLALIAVELVTGFFGLVSGSSDKAAFLLIHRVSGYGILLVLLWKAHVVLFSLRRKKAAAPRAASIALGAALVIALALGFGWTFAGPFAFEWFSGMSWHIYAGAALVPILAWHSFVYTRGFRRPYRVDRRWFLRLAGVAAVGLAFSQLGELGARAANLRGASRRFTGSYEAAQRGAGVFPVVSWLNDRPAPVDATLWRLSIGGAVRRYVVLSYDDIGPLAEIEATIDCTGGWYSTQVWSGVPVAHLLDMAGPSERVSSVTFTSVTGYYRRFSLKEARRYLLATHVGGRPLSHGHGFPMRLAAPGKRGFEWVKWVASIEVNETPKWLQPPLPLR